MAQELKVFTTNWPDCYHSTIVYIDGDQIVATCMVTYEGKDKKEAVLWNLQVKKDYRNCGLGKLLLKAAIDDAVLHRCPAIDLEWSPMDSVGWVFDWYKSYGFKVVSCCNKVRMTLTLQKGGKQ